MKSKLYVLALHRLLIVLFFCLLFQNISVAQPLVITENQTQQEAEQMILDIFVGTGVQVFNVSYQGFPQASGSFVGNTDVGLDNGFLMTSGRASIAKGPNNLSNAGTSNGALGDSDLNLLGGGTSLDACIMNFDFIPYAKYITFKFSFASEEYPEYAPPNNSSFNDKFGFFLSGPGIEGPYSNNSVNIATLPNSSTVVSINTVNAVTNQEYFVSNWNPVVNNNIQYDGYTTLIDIVAAVEPMQTYHLKLAISDGGDRIFDSGLFFKAFSFRSTDVLNAEEIPATPNKSTLVSPNPGHGHFTFDLSKMSSGKGIFELYNTNGSKLQSGQAVGVPDFLLDMSSYPEGVYFVRFVNNQQQETHKLINK